MRTLQWAFLLLNFVWLTACGTNPVSEPVEKLPPAQPQKTPAPEYSGPRIDYGALKTSLGLDRPATELGFNEKAFDTCQVGYGYSGTQYCHREHFVVIHFRLMCRDSEGTVSTGINNVDMEAISRKNVKWNLKGISGTVETDSDGFGQISTVSPVSQRTQRLRLAVGPEFLYMRANEITKVVTPKPWCQAY